MLQDFKDKSKKSLFRTFKMIKKEFRLLRIDPWNLVIALLIPPAIIMLFSFMTEEAGVPPPLPVIVVSNDSNTFINPNNYAESTWDNFSIPYINAVNKSNLLELKVFLNSTEDPYSMEIARQELLLGNINSIIVIPVEFTELLNLGYPGLIECIIDSSRISKIQDNINAVYDSIRIFVNDNNLTPQIKLKGFEEFSVPPGYNQALNANITQLLPLMVFGIANVLTILVIVKENPISRLLLTPIKKSEILISKYFTYSIVLFIQDMGIILATLASGLYIRGSIFELFGALYMIGYSGISMGLFISTLSKSKTEANQLFFASFIIIILLSGLFVPLGSMPIYLNLFAQILPLSHANPLVDSVLSKGTSILEYHFYILLIVSFILNIITFLVFYKRRYEV
ncbi:MAG: ABC transporter permease [Candidatus Lokiarchaeota archaeon]|nr:ABC transporter permease [Candidatus Lokiarchaeota archaeon]